MLVVILANVLMTSDVSAKASGSSVALVAAPSLDGQIVGSITDAKTSQPIPGAILKLDDGDLWTISDADGRYKLTGLKDGTYIVEASCLGYVAVVRTVTLKDGDIVALDGLDKAQIDKVNGVEQDMALRDHAEFLTADFLLNPESLALDEVVVTAQKSNTELNTSMSLDKTALEHLQMSNMSDISSLLPGGKTVNPDLTQNNVLDLRSGGTDAGNSSFGTALEVDGVRIGNNAGFGELKGVGTRNVAVDNIESIEVITGVPSAEYGDMGNGMVKINTRKGRTPVNVNLSVNPRTWQVSASKGFDLLKERGVINASLEWVNAKTKLTSPYTSYTRRNISVGYSNLFKGNVKFDINVTGNIGGMNSKDDPDAFSGEYSKCRDNVFRANTSVAWVINKPGITSLNFDASVNYNDDLDHSHIYNSSASILPAVHSESEGYWLANRLPMTFFADQYIDSKELDYAASLKYVWAARWDHIKNGLKAGVQWKSSGNVGEGEYYADPALAEDGYRPRPYRQYPFMHNLAVYVEDHIKIPVSKTLLEITAGLRMENVFIKNSKYDHLTTWSPRFNAKWKFCDAIAIRGGWGITEKLPSFFVLYPKQEYRDIRTFEFSHGDNSSYVYYTQPYETQTNPALKWQRNMNSEFGIEAKFLGTKLSIVGFYNETLNPYRFTESYDPLTYNRYKRPDDFVMPDDPQIKIDHSNGNVFLRGADSDYWTPMEIETVDHTFVRNVKQDNGEKVKRMGIELIVDFPEIKPIKTSFRLDAAYNYTKYVDESLKEMYSDGWSHTSLSNRSYQYVGIYPIGASQSVANGKVSHSLDANLTAITHIPQARIVITCRLEASLFKRTRNISSYNGEDYAFTVTQFSETPTGGNIYDGNSYTAIRPIAYKDLDGNVYPFTEAEAVNPDFANLIIKSGNMYTFNQDGYGAYLSANISVTKEIGDHVSLSFFANNFTNSRMAVKSKATGVSAIFTPNFYYGITCRLKL